MFNVIANEYFSMIFFADKNYTLQNGKHNHTIRKRIGTVVVFMQHSQLGNVKGQKRFKTIKQQLLGRFIQWCKQGERLRGLQLPLLQPSHLEILGQI